MRVIAIGLGFVLATGLGTVSAEPTRFDGDWKLTLRCPATTEGEGAKGYTHYLPVQVKDGELTATYGTEGEPGWQYLHGKIAPDGASRLVLEGIVDKSDHAVSHGPTGKNFSYKVVGRFDAKSGTGRRTSGRDCGFEFSR